MEAEVQQEERRKTNSYPIGKCSGNLTVRGLNGAYVVGWETLISITIINEKTKYLSQIVGWYEDSIEDRVSYAWS